MKRRGERATSTAQIIKQSKFVDKLPTSLHYSSQNGCEWWKWGRNLPFLDESSKNLNRMIEIDEACSNQIANRSQMVKNSSYSGEYGCKWSTKKKYAIEICQYFLINWSVMSKVHLKLTPKWSNIVQIDHKSSDVIRLIDQIWCEMVNNSNSQLEWQMNE